jgi:DNA-binding transcriptional LysR family regulator
MARRRWSEGRIIGPRHCCNKRNFQYTDCVERINFDLQQLQAFVAVADKGSFRAAAEHIHLSAPALGRRVGKLEEILGARLFTRSTRDVRLTRVGDAFLERARAALDDLESAVLGIHEISARHAGRVSIACVPSAATSFMPRAIQSFCEKMPRVRIRVIDEGMNEVAAAVVTGEADFAFGFNGSADAPLDFEPLWHDPYVLALRRDDPLARRRTLKVADLGSHAWVSVAHTSRNRQVLDQYFGARGRAPQAWLEVAHVTTLLAMVEAGLGVGIVPSLAIPQGHPNVVGVKLGDVEAMRQIGLLTLEGRRLTPVAQRFYDHLRSMFKRAGGGAAPPQGARSKRAPSTTRRERG